jgi:arginine/lysine/ornithine decarboxylase
MAGEQEQQDAMEKEQMKALAAELFEFNRMRKMEMSEKDRMERYVHQQKDRMEIYGSWFRVEKP